jgi:radical SAM superfamily enzyme YgiQ (UPF0313 family)
MKKNIILFQPILGDLDSMRTKPGLPLGLLHCASIVCKSYDVKIIDERISRDWKNEIDQYISKDTICAGITALSGYSIKSGLEFSKYIKERYSIPVVWGGVHATILSEQTIANQYVDIVVEGEGEITLNELVSALEKGEDLNTVEGIWYKDDGHIKHTGKREYADLDELPSVPYDLIDVNDYLSVYMNTKSLRCRT